MHNKVCSVALPFRVVSYVGLFLPRAGAGGRVEQNERQGLRDAARKLLCRGWQG